MFVNFNTRVNDSVDETIGQTPMVRLRRLAAGLPAQVVVKLESRNPGGSVKDRIGLAMIDEAERRGRIEPGTHQDRGADVGQYGDRPGDGGRGPRVSGDADDAGELLRRAAEAARRLRRASSSSRQRSRG